MKIHTDNSPAFGRIRAEHMFIKIPEYGLDIGWAKHSASIANRAKDLAQPKRPFEKLFKFVCDEYNKFFVNHKNGDLFGVIRQDTIPFTYILDKNQYASYVDKMVEFLRKKGASGHDMMYGKLSCVSSYSTRLSDTKLTTVNMISRKLSAEEEQMYGRFCVKMRGPASAAITPVFKEINHIYDRVLRSKNVSETTKNIGKIHWYLSQLTPCNRGSAATADITAKALFESKGIQASAWKQGVDPNLEAYIAPLGKYARNYKNFFEAQPYKIK